MKHVFESEFLHSVFNMTIYVLKLRSYGLFIRIYVKTLKVLLGTM